MKRKKAPETVVLDPVDEILGLDENAGPDDITYDESLLIEEIKASEFMLNSVNRQLDGFVRDFEKDPSARDEMETAYTFKIDVLGNLAKVFLPLTQYGRKQIREIRKCSREYESFAAPLITNITAENAEAFSKVLTEDMREDVEAGKLHALGAIRTEAGRQFAAGAIVYNIEYSNFVDANLGRIFWLYVHEDFRERGIGDHLIAELVGSMLEHGVEYITMDSSLGDDADVIKGYIMASWKFRTETGINPDTMIRIQDIKNYSKIKDNSKGAKSIASLEGGINANGVKNALKRFSRPSYLSDEVISGGYIDTELSFYLGNETSVTGLLLTHRLPSGKVRVEYLKAEDDRFESHKKLLSAFIKEAVSKCGDDTLLYIPIESFAVAEYLEEISPIQMGQYLLEGLISPPTADLDVTVEDVNAILELNADEIDALLAEADLQ